MVQVDLSTAMGVKFSCLACLDTGSDYCLFPKQFAKPIGLDTLTMEKRWICGVGGIPARAYFAKITTDIVLPGGECISVPMRAGFTDGLDTVGFGLLGHHDFFDAFVVTFNGTKRAFTIEQNHVAE